MLLDKKNAGIVIKAIALLVSLAFIASMFALYSAQTPTQAPQPQSQAVQNTQVDARAKVLQAQLKRSPKNVAIARELGDLYWDAGGANGQAGDATTAAQYFALATNAYATVLKQQPKDANVRTDMATAYFYSGDPTRALKELDVVLAADPKHENALFNVGLINKQMGNTAAAKAAWQRYLAVAPKGETADKIRQELSQLK